MSNNIVMPNAEDAEWIRTKAIATATSKCPAEKKEAKLVVAYGERVIQARQRCDGITDVEAQTMARDHVGKPPRDFGHAIDAWNHDRMADLKQEAEVQKQVAAAKEATTRAILDRFTDQLNPVMLAAPLSNGHAAAE